MPKTRRKKINTSPGRAFRNSRAYIAEKGDMVTTVGIRGRTRVVRVTGPNDDDTKRVASVRLTEEVKQLPSPKAIGDKKPIAIWVGRQYTGVARGKPYPYRSTKRGAPAAPAPVGLMGGLRKAARAVKKVIVKEG